MVEYQIILMPGDAGASFLLQCSGRISTQVMLEHVNITVGERWEDDMERFWYKVGMTKY